jgi:RHS repeat-associated protein
VVGLFTATGTTLTGSITYDPLGKVLNTSGMLGNLGYQSGWTEGLTGRVNMHSRWYNSDTGQFDTRDTWSNDPTPASGNANRFAYANSNPLTGLDPTGHQRTKEDGDGQTTPKPPTIPIPPPSSNPNNPTCDYLNPDQQRRAGCHVEPSLPGTWPLAHSCDQEGSGRSASCPTQTHPCGFLPRPGKDHAAQP